MNQEKAIIKMLEGVELDIEEVRLVKKNCESQLLTLIHDFEKIANVTVQDISVQTIKTEQDSHYRIGNIRLEIRF